MSAYDKSGQRVYFVREGSYGKPYDPESSGITAWTQVPADYPHWRKLDYITDGFEASLPKIEKIKQFDVSDGKHASSIASGNIAPQDITLTMDGQALEFLPMAVGAPAYSSHGRAMTQVLTFTTAQPTQGDYFLFDVITSTGAIQHYAVWSDTAGDGSTGKPTITGINASNVLAANTSACASVTDVADAVELIIETTLGGGGTADITSADNVAGVLTLIHARAGAVQPARDSGSAFDVTVSVTTWGSTTYSITEALTSSIPSFTLHFEQQNNTSSADILWDIFGCVVKEIVINNVFSDNIIKYDVTFACPYATAGLRCTNPPPRKQIQTYPSMFSIQESASNYIIMEGTTDRTPQTVTSVVLTISNTIVFQPNINSRHMVQAYAGERKITLKIIGQTTEKELFNYWQGAFTLSGSDWIPSGASGRLNSVFKLQRDATYDYLTIAFYNWVCFDHNFAFATVDDAVKNVDMTLEDGTADTNGRIITSFSYVSYMDRTILLGTK